MFFWLLFLMVAFLAPSFICGPKFMSNGSMLKINAPGCMLWITEPIANFDGTLRVDHESFGRVVAQTVQFDRAIIRTDLGAEFYYTGVFDFNYYNQMFLNDGCIINYKAGLASKAIVVQPNATASVMGSPEFMFDVTLTDSTSTLILGLQKKMDANLVLNGGTVILKDDLRFKEGCMILNGGNIDINNRNLRIPGGDFINAELTLHNTSGLFFDADTTLSHKLHFKGNSTTSKVSANSFTLTLQLDGSLCLLEPNSRLEITNVVIKDKCEGEEDALERHMHFDIHPTSTVVLQDCTIELNDDFYHNSGTIEFRDGCKIIHKSFDVHIKEGAFIVLNGASLIYDSLNQIDRNPFIFHDVAKQKIVVNNGEIRSSNASASLLLNQGSFVFYSDYVLSQYSTMEFASTTPDLHVTTTADFNGHSLTFPLNQQLVLKLAPNLTLEILNAELFDYNQTCIHYGNANSELYFGDGVKMKLFKMETVGSNDRAWHITGDVSIAGKGAPLVLDGSQRMLVHENATVTFEDLRVVVNRSDSLKMLGQNSKVIFSNCTLVLQNGVEWLIDQGSVEIKDALKVFGGKPYSNTSNSSIVFASSGSFLVGPNSLLKLCKNVVFKYQANPVNDQGSLAASKRHFVLQDLTSILELEGGTLHSTETGLALDHGSVIVSDTAMMIIDGSNGTEAEIGSAVDFYVKPSMSFTFSGTLAYNATELDRLY